MEGETPACDVVRSWPCPRSSFFPHMRPVDALDRGSHSNGRSEQREFHPTRYDEAPYSATTPVDLAAIPETYGFIAADRARRRPRRIGHLTRAEFPGSTGELRPHCWSAHPSPTGAYPTSPPSRPKQNFSQGVFNSRSDFSCFNGESCNEDYLDWEREVDEFFYCAYIPQERQVKHVVHKLIGRAKTWWVLIVHARRLEGRSEVTSWRKMKILLRSQFLTSDYELVSDVAKPSGITEVERAPASGEVVKEGVHNRTEEQYRLMERDVSEETLTREFLKMLDAEANCKQLKAEILVAYDENQGKKKLIPALDNGLDPLIQTKDVSFMASMNQFSDKITRKETPKLTLHQRSMELFDLMMSEGFKVQSETASCVLVACPMVDAIRSGEGVRCPAIRLGFELDSYFCSSLITVYANVGLINVTFRLFNSMPSKEVHLWNSMIFVLFSNFASEALNVKPDSIAIKNILSVCSKVCWWEFGRKIHGLLVKTPDLNTKVVQNSLINIYVKIGDVDGATMLVSFIEEWDVILLSSTITGFWQNKLYNHALKIFIQLFDGGFIPDSGIVAGIVYACTAMGWLPLGYEIHALAIKNGTISDSFVADALISLYSKCDSPLSAGSIFSAVAKKNLKGLLDELITTFTGIARNGLHSNHDSFLALMFACSHTVLLEQGLHYQDLITNVYSLHHPASVGNLSSVLAKLYMGENRIHGSLPESIGWLKGLELLNMTINYISDEIPQNISQLSNLHLKDEGLKKALAVSSIELHGIIYEFFMGDISHAQTEEVQILVADKKFGAYKLSELTFPPKPGWRMMLLQGFELESSSF